MVISNIAFKRRKATFYLECKYSCALKITFRIPL